MGKKKILIIRLGAIGDVVHTTIIAEAIKLKHPDWEVHYLTQNEIAPILENNPYIDKVLPLITARKRDNSYIISVGKELFRERYDIVFNLTNALRNLLLAAMSCPKKIVFRKHTKGLWVEDFFYTAKSVIKDIDLPERLVLGTDNNTSAKIETFLSNYPKPYFMIIPGGATDKNRQGRIWNINNWKELISKLQQKYGGTIFVCGGGNEREYHEQLQQDNVVITSGDFDLKESSTLLSKSDLVISGDTGPLHIASAHNVKTLALLGSTSPEKIKPYGKNGYYISSDFECKYCWKKKCKYLKNKKGENYTPCMEELSPSIVYEKILKLLD